MNIAIILSGGTGMRLGAELPKQYIEVCGKTMIGYCLETFEKCAKIDALQIVAEKQWQDLILDEYKRLCGLHGEDNGKLRGFSEPGITRQLSIWHALEDIRSYASEEDLVIVHDAARPLLSIKMLEDVISAAAACDGAIPVLPMKDTVYFTEDGKHITALLERSRVIAGQAPESFVFGKYYEANRRLLPEKILEINGSTEPAILAGMDIAVVEGEEQNFKITTQADLERFGQIIKEGVNIYEGVCT